MDKKRSITKVWGEMEKWSYIHLRKKKYQIVLER